MGVSAFPGRENRLPNIERAAQDACARLTQASSESLDDRLRELIHEQRRRKFSGIEIPRKLRIPRSTVKRVIKAAKLSRMRTCRDEARALRQRLELPLEGIPRGLHRARRAAPADAALYAAH